MERITLKNLQYQIDTLNDYSNHRYMIEHVNGKVRITDEKTQGAMITPLLSKRELHEYIRTINNYLRFEKIE